ncbi:transposase family protein [Streptomyces sp. MJM1172]|uniref:transposase family protein n=1 Tax=Streptomyces sp. MJM1172 TaxID=1703926 RepID=UPI001F52614E|nr:transposase family protein [Streptomyces sp. MJM1172]
MQTDAPFWDSLVFDGIGDVDVEAVTAGFGTVEVVARGRATGSACPDCGRFSQRVHDRYQRRLQDLPLADQGFVIRLTARRFFCAATDCPRRTFAEPFFQLAAPHARFTKRLNHALERVGLALAGRAGARLAAQMGFGAGRMTRRVMALPDPKFSTPRNGGGPEIIPGLDPADVFGGTPGEPRGPRWRRLRWAELSRRTGDPVAAEGRLPCYRSFPSLREPGGWPVGIAGPSEGSLDRDDWNRLVDILTEHSPQGAETRCLAYYNPLLQRAEDFDNLHVRAGALADAKVLYDHPEQDGWTPSNLWSQDRSWVLCTDYDLWATKVAGPAPLVEALLNDTEIEALRLPWAL